MVDVNIKGTVWLARAAVRQFREQGDGGDIVIIGSVAGLHDRRRQGGGLRSDQGCPDQPRLRLGP